MRQFRYSASSSTGKADDFPPDCESLCNKLCQNVLICSDLLLSAQVEQFCVPVCRLWAGRGGWGDFVFKQRP